MNSLNVLCAQLTRDLFAIAKFCLVPFLPVILIFVYFCIKVDEESDLLFRANFSELLLGLLIVTVMPVAC